MKTKSHGAAFAIPWPRSCGRAVLAMCRWLALPIWRARSPRQGRVTPSHPKNLPDVFQANDVPAMSDKLTMLKWRQIRSRPDSLRWSTRVCSTGARVESHERSPAERVRPQSRDRTHRDIQTARKMMRFGFRRVAAVTTDGAPMFSAPPRRAPWIHGARRFVLAFRSL